MTAERISIVLAEDQGLVLSALGELLGYEPDIAVVARAADGDIALEAVRTHAPDVLVTDIEMPGRTGIDCALVLRQEGLKTRTLIVTTYDRPGWVARARAADVAGYLLKDAPIERLADAIRRVARGERVYAATVADDVAVGTDPLTSREKAVLRLAEEGLSNKTIALALGLSAGTVRNYPAEANGKLGTAGRIDATRRARQMGWL